MTVGVVRVQGWRWAYYLTGIPGLFLAVLILTTTTDSRKNSPALQQESNTASEDSQDPTGTLARNDAVEPELPIHRPVWNGLRHVFQPTVLLILVAACTRQTGNICKRQTD